MSTVYRQIMEQGCKGSILNPHLKTLSQQERNVKNRLFNLRRTLEKCSAEQLTNTANRGLVVSDQELERALVAIEKVKANQKNDGDMLR